MHIFYGWEKSSKMGPQPGLRAFAGFFLSSTSQTHLPADLVSCSASSSCLLMVEALQQNLHLACRMKHECKNSKHHGEAPARLGAVARDAGRPHTAVLTAGMPPWLFPCLSCSCHSQSQLLFLKEQRLWETAVGKFVTLRVFQSKWQSIGTTALTISLANRRRIGFSWQQGLDVMSRSQCWSFKF